MSTDTSSYKFNHTMLRVKDPKASVKFYEHLGMKMIKKIEQPEAKFDLYFMGYDGAKAASHGKEFSEREGLIELTHNYGSEDKEGRVYTNGNEKSFNGQDVKQGFGHTCISVDNLQAACQRIEDAGYKFQKKLSDGRMRSIAFVLDPDQYWVEVIGQNPVEKTENIKETDTETYSMNHTMLRVKNAVASLRFYQEVLGMQLLRTSENKDAGFNLYFLGYGSAPTDTETANGVNPVAKREGLLELTWNYGTEKEEGLVYADGNQEPQGFGHIAIAVDNLQAACKRFDEYGVTWKKRLEDGRMSNLAFIKDIDGYWLEIIEQSK